MTTFSLTQVIRDLADGYKPSESPQINYRNFCARAIESVRTRGANGEIEGYRKEEPREHNDAIFLLERNENNIMVISIDFEEAKNTYRSFDERGTDRLGSRFGLLPHDVRLRYLKKWAWTVINTTIPVGSQTHPFNELKIVIGVECVAFILKHENQTEEEQTRMFIEFRPLQNKNGSQIRNYTLNRNDERTNDPEEVEIDEILYEDLAASEFVEIIKFSLSTDTEQPLKTLAKLEIDIDEPLDNTLPSLKFIRKIKYWMSRQKDQFINTQHFVRRKFKEDTEENLILDSSFLRASVLESITHNEWESARS